METTLVDGGDVYGSAAYSVEPWFAAVDRSAVNKPSVCGAVSTNTVLGRYTHAPGEASMVRAEAERCNLIFAGTPGLPASLYRNTADQAGVHRYLSGVSADDVSVEAGGHAIFLHCGRGDRPCDGLTVHLPAAVAAVFADELDGPMPEGADEAPLCHGLRHVICR